MRVNDATLAHFEGLVFKTAVMYERRLRVEREDLQQVLRLRVWRAVCAFDASRNRAGLDSFVFTCVRNQIKDLVKSRINRDKLGIEYFISDLVPDESRDRFEAKHLAAELGDEFATELNLPDGLTDGEQEVIGLLNVGYAKKVEIARVLGISRAEVNTRFEGIRTKLTAAGWAPRGGAEILQLALPVQRVLEAAA